jgi:RHS repeat-associated protein
MFVKHVAAAVIGTLVVSSLSAPAAMAAKPFQPAAPQQIPSVPTRDVAPVDTAGHGVRRSSVRPPVWPGAGSTAVRAAGAKVTVFDRARAKSAGIDGVLARVESADKPTVDVTVDYSSFAGAYGAAWSTRLRLATLPECALATPDSAACAPVPMASRNDVSAKTISATVPAGALVATVAGSSSGSGDYTATKLAASSTWTSGGNSGDFSWSYPMRVPPAVGGPAPQVALSYSAQSVDGQIAASNNQPGWAGAGFDLAPGGSIERRYKGCADDMTGGNNAVKTGDLCWATDNAMLSLGSHSGELIYNLTDQHWHLRNDDGTRIQRRTSAVNGDNDGEYWVVTTTDGTQYWFGRNRLPGWTTGNDTNSAWTAPVYGNHTGEPCHQSTFAASSCAQAWRWNLDYVIDMNGNSMSLWYASATNKYAANNDTAHPVPYTRDGWLTKIEYGTMSNKDLVVDPTQATAADSIFSAPAPMEVEFVPDDRCLSACTTHDALHWTDVPWDQECLGSTCATPSPTFWSTKRLKQVITKVRNGSSYRTVETWTLTHAYPDPGDGTAAPLRLDRLAHSAGSDSVPDMTFSYVQKNNRVDPVAADGLPPMNWFRISQITTETGATISVTYSGVDCVKGSKMPNLNALEANTYRCFPVRWTPPGVQTSVVEFFHKYVVTVIRENDNTGGTPPFGSREVEHSYTYPADAAAWHYTDEDGLIKDQNKTWSQWRGYPWVGVTTGKAGVGDTQSYTQTSYFRGMNGDHLPSGTRSVSLAAVDMNGDGDTADTGIDAPALNDENAWAGRTRTTTVSNGPGGAEVSSTVDQLWRSTPTATRTIGTDTVEARFTGTEATHSRVKLDHAPTWRTTSTFTQFDGYGMPVKQDDFADDALATDNRCTVTVYDRNTTAWILDTAQEVTTFALSCAAAANPATLTEADVISNVRTSYDGLAWGATPAKGQDTQSAKATAWTAGNPTDQAITKSTYDPQGRVIETYDGLNRETSTVYTPTSGGPLTQTAVTQPSPFLFTTTTTLDPAYGLPTLTVDVNGKRTEQTYNGFGQLKAVWLPGRDRATQTANMTYDYKVYATKPSVVIESRLNPVGGYTTGYTLFDGLMRTRQTQIVSPSGGRILTDTYYDTAGRVLRAFGAYYDNRGGPGETLVTPLDMHNVPQQTYNLYDGVGRTTDVVFDPYNNGERWRTHSVYTGDRTDVTPPAGGTSTSTYVDARGNPTALWQYGYPTVTDHVTTTYQYNRKNELSRITDNAGNHWDYTYWLAGQINTTTDPDSGQSTVVYDKAGQLSSSQNALGQTLVYDYDNLGRKIGLYLGSKSTANKRATWNYDTAYFDGTAAQAKGQPTASTRWTANGTVPYTKAVSGYYADYRPTGTAYTIPATETGLANSYTYLNTYREDGSPESMQYPGFGDLGDEAVTNVYEPTLGLPNQLTTIDESGESSHVSGTVYDALARPSQYTLYTGLFSRTGSKVWLAFQRELETGRLTNITTSREAVTPNVVTNLNYTYDNAGNVTKISDTANADTQCFTYDRLRRLTEAWTPSTTTCGTPSTAGLGGPAKYWNAWVINAIGDRTQQVEHATTVGGADKTTNYGYPAAGAAQPHTLTGTSGAVVGTYKYDALGNTTCRPAAASNVCPTSGTTGSQILTWDPEGHLATSADSTGSTSYVYDADGNRLLRTDPAGKTLYLPGEELRYAGGQSSCTRYYSFNGVTVASRNGSGLTWLTADHQGTAEVSINATTQAATIRRQTPYGTRRGGAVSWPNTKGFVGGTSDNTGLTHLGAREYDPAVGRFISVDPVFDRSDPQSWSGYAYANNTPVTASDPTGLFAFLDGVDGWSDKDMADRRVSGHVPHKKRTTAHKPSGPTCRGSENSGGCGYDHAKPCLDKGEHSCGGKAVDSSGEHQTIMWDPSRKKMVNGKPCGIKCFSKWGCVAGKYCSTSLPDPGGTAGICVNGAWGFAMAGSVEYCVHQDSNGLFWTKTTGAPRGDNDPHANGWDRVTHSFWGLTLGGGVKLEASNAIDRNSLKGPFYSVDGSVAVFQAGDAWGSDANGRFVNVVSIGGAGGLPYGATAGTTYTEVHDFP